MLLTLLACASEPAPFARPGLGENDTSYVPADTGTPWWHASLDDADDDGVSRTDGDCDELRADVHPGAQDDTCDGVDQDCDGFVDGGAQPDPYEPNDADATWLGDFGEEGETVVLGALFPEADVDAYGFAATDGDFSRFDLEAWAMDVPAGVDLALELAWVSTTGAEEIVAGADDLGVGGDEVLLWGGSAGTDDSGVYVLRVTGQGADCGQRYLLHLLVGSW